MNTQNRRLNPDSRQRLARLRLAGFDATKAPRAPECQPRQTTLHALATACGHRPSTASLLAVAASSLKPQAASRPHPAR